MERKVHYKRYKSGKFWVAALISVSLGTVGVITIPQFFEAVPVYADGSATDITATVGPAEFTKYFQWYKQAAPLPIGPDGQPQQGYQVQLTDNIKNQVGGITLATKIDMEQSFTLTGRLYLGEFPNGADGVAFGFADADPGAVGQTGNAFGIGGLPNAFGVKFDEYYNGTSQGVAAADIGDPNMYPEMRVVKTDSTIPAIVRGVKGDKGVFYENFPAPDNKYYNLTVNYDGKSKRMTVEYAGKSISFDATPYITKPQLSMFLVGSTGDTFNQHVFDFLSFNYTPGINAVKVDLKNRLAKEADTQKQAVNADPTLTSGERTTQSNSIDGALKTGLDEIDAATTTPDVVNAFDHNKPIIQAIHKSGQPLDQRKADKKKQLQAEHDKIVADIKNDPTLPAADKPRQITNTGTALTNANTVVDAATDADHVDSAFNDGIIAIDKAHVPGATLDAQRQAKKDALDTAAATVKQAIQDDATLTSAEKKIQTDAVDKALTDGKAAIDKAMNADDINTAADTALTNINSAHKPGPSLADQRTQQKQALQTKHDQVVNEINLDPTLTSTEKNDQIKKADQALTDGNKAIDDAVTADAIIDAATIGQQAIEKAHETGTPIDDQKNTQRKRLNAEATAVKQKIQDDVTLTTAEKTKQTANVDTALADGLKNINDATTADAINAAGDKGIADIDGMYKTGTPLDKQKTDQKQAIDAEAAKIKKDIQNDPTLTATEKTKQSGDVDKAAEDGKKAVDAATNADAIITAASGAIKNIDDAHLPGKSLDDQRNAKKAEIDKAATDAKKTIQDDPTLTTAEKNPQLDAVDKAVTDGKIAIDAATDADGINKAGDDAINVIGSIHQPGKPLAEQRDAKKAEIDTAAANAKKAIQDDPTLTTKEKNEQIAVVDKAVTKGKAAVDAATDADGINKAGDAAIDTINKAHQPGKSIAEQQAAQKQAIADEAAKVKKDIQDDPTLTTTEKNNQSGAVDKAAEDAANAIDKATTADDINKAFETGKTNIDNAHKPGTSVDDQKANQKKALENEAAKVKQAIQDDPTLTTVEKQNQTTDVDKALKDGTDAIDKATNADDINKAFDTGKTNIDNAHQPGTAIDDQKAAQKKSLKDEAAKVKQDIQDDPTLTTAEKQKQTDDVDQALKDGTAAIDKATNADDINKAFDTGKANIDNAHKPGTAVDDQKANQKKALEDEAAKVKQDIQGDPTLTTKEKQQQTGDVDKALEDGKKAIDAAKDADGVNNAFSDGKKTIDDAHKPGTSIDDQKTAKKQSLADEAAKVKQDIQDDPTLTTGEKQKQAADVDQALKDGTAAIDKATNTDDINTAFDTGKTNIDNAHKSGTAIDDQKAAQKKSLEDEATKVKQEIQDDLTLTTAEKKQQTADVDQALKDGTAAIDKATNADDINTAFDTGKTNIDNAHQPGTSIDDQKAAQKKSLEDEAAKIKQDIQDDPTLTTAEKQKQAADVDQALKDGTAAIDKATNADDINTAFDTGKINIDNAHQPGTAIDDQKAAKKQSLADEAAKVKQDIQNDKTLKTAEKKQQSADVDQAFKDGEAAIDAATNADDVNKAFDTGKINIDNAHRPGQSVDDQKEAQKQFLDDEAAKVKQAIQDDPTLTTAEKQQQSADVDKALKDGNAAIDAANNADDISKAFDTGKINIDNAHRPGTAIDEQKAAQKKHLAEEAAKVSQEIQDDPTLTTPEKQQQTADVDQAYRDGEAAIDAATNADDINKAFDTGKINIDNAHQPGKAIADQKDAQKKHLAEEAAKVKQEIQDDPTLTTTEKQKQTADVDQAYKDGEAAIDAATTADDINKAFDTGKTNIDNAHQPGTALDNHKAAQKKSLAEEAAKVKQEIQDDPTLTTAEKQKQAADVDQAYKDGEAAIDAATTADDINKAFDTGKVNIDNAHKPGTAIDDQKAAQKKFLDEEATKVKQAIQDDPTLTTAEKQRQTENVDKALKDGNAAIDAATNADDINKAFDTGKINIDNAHQPGAAIDDQKASQKKHLAEEAAKVKQEIQDDPTLTTAEKQKQAADVDQAYKDGEAAIDAATTADDINKAFDTGKVNIDNAHKPGTAVDDQKAAQKKQLAEEADKVKQAIQDDSTLTTAEKKQQSENVDKALVDGQRAIDQASDADSINTAFVTGKANINTQHQPGKSLADQRQAAVNEIDKEAAKVKQQIDNDPLLTEAEKATQKARVDHEAALAKEALAKAGNADELNAALADGIKNIDAQYVPGTQKAPDPKPTPAPLPGDPRPTSTQPLSTSRTSTSSLPRTSDKPATGLAALGAFLLSMFGFALTGKKRKRS
ncbi:DUF1542 domain-containing protein [Lacticaseibacillus chiayiensis]|uniref:DUF1542 domain-containing protein n=1 Tax=Lacticaseibacillus chiayiensis TaxID=2100821 RepID=UPI001BCF189B|nr:DUF1542 domain-containing protein [Lacticaseibacillus chiayiensis]QVI34487.1 DUF1542 domain-containing protein [Lacticaseibacillus chiayiensis]